MSGYAFVSMSEKPGPKDRHWVRALTESTTGSLPLSDALGAIAQRRGQSLAQMALAWVLRDARMTSALIGASSAAQVRENVAALERVQFSGDELAEIDRHAQEGGVDLWRGPSTDQPV